MPGQDDLSPRLQRLWRMHPPARLGRKPELDLDQIVEAAVTVADTEGLDAATMARVAKELGYSAMSLYRHVSGRDELIELMADAAADDPPDPPPGADWRETLEAYALAIRDTYRRRPWGLQLPITAPPLGPRTLAWLEAGLQATRDHGLDAGERIGVVMLLFGHVRHAGMLEAGLRGGIVEQGLDAVQAERDYARTLARLVTPDRYPELAALAEDGSLDVPDDVEDLDPDADFRFGLERILDGVGVLIEQRATAGR